MVKFKNYQFSYHLFPKKNFFYKFSSYIEFLKNDIYLQL